MQVVGSRRAAAALACTIAAVAARAQAQSNTAQPSTAQTSAAQTTPDLVVRVGSGAERRVPVLSVETASGPRDYIRLDALATAVGAQLTLRTGGARLDVAGATLDLRDNLQYVRAGVTTLPLIAGPVRDARGLLVPAQFAIDLLPRVVRTLAYDPATRTLRTARVATRGSTRSSAPQPAVTTASDEDANDAPSVRLPSIPPRGRTSARTDAHSDAARPDARADSRPETPAEVAGVAGALDGERRHRTVAIDAGHGGQDAGMRGTLADGSPLYEKEVTLGVARALRDALTERNIGVVMTRTTDTLIALGDRGRIANSHRADLFISVHVNAANPAWRDPSGARGFETYFLSDARTEEARQVADRENASARYETGLTGNADPLRFVISDLAQNSYMRESSRLAAAIQARLARVHPGPNRQVHQAGFKVLVTAAMPAVLVEVGFGSNAADAAYLASSRGRRELADAIAGAVNDFLTRYGGRPASP